MRRRKEVSVAVWLLLPALVTAQFDLYGASPIGRPSPRHQPTPFLPPRAPLAHRGYQPPPPPLPFEGPRSYSNGYAQEPQLSRPTANFEFAKPKPLHQAQLPPPASSDWRMAQLYQQHPERFGMPRIPQPQPQPPHRMVFTPQLPNRGPPAAAPAAPAMPTLPTRKQHKQQQVAPAGLTSFENPPDITNNIIVHVYLNSKERPSHGSRGPVIGAFGIETSLGGPGSRQQPVLIQKDFDKDRLRFIDSKTAERLVEQGNRNIVEVRATVSAPDAAIQKTVDRAVNMELDKAIPAVVRRFRGSTTAMDDDLRKELEQALVDEIAKNLGDTIDNMDDITEEDLGQIIEEGFNELEGGTTTTTRAPLIIVQTGSPSKGTMTTTVAPTTSQPTKTTKRIVTTASSTRKHTTSVTEEPTEPTTQSTTKRRPSTGTTTGQPTTHPTPKITTTRPTTKSTTTVLTTPLTKSTKKLVTKTTTESTTEPTTKPSTTRRPTKPTTRATTTESSTTEITTVQTSRRTRPVPTTRPTVWVPRITPSHPTETEEPTTAFTTTRARLKTKKPTTEPVAPSWTEPTTEMPWWRQPETTTTIPKYSSPTGVTWNPQEVPIDYQDGEEPEVITGTHPQAEVPPATIRPSPTAPPPTTRAPSRTPEPNIIDSGEEPATFEEHLVPMHRPEPISPPATSAPASPPSPPSPPATEAPEPMEPKEPIQMSTKPTSLRPPSPPATEVTEPKEPEVTSKNPTRPTTLKPSSPAATKTAKDDEEPEETTQMHITPTSLRPSSPPSTEATEPNMPEVTETPESTVKKTEGTTAIHVKPTMRPAPPVVIPGSRMPTLEATTSTIAVPTQEPETSDHQTPIATQQPEEPRTHPTHTVIEPTTASPTAGESSAEPSSSGSVELVTVPLPTSEEEERIKTLPPQVFDSTETENEEEPEPRIVTSRPVHVVDLGDSGEAPEMPSSEMIFDEDVFYDLTSTLAPCTVPSTTTSMPIFVTIPSGIKHSMEFEEPEPEPEIPHITKRPPESFGDMNMMHGEMPEIMMEPTTALTTPSASTSPLSTVTQSITEAANTEPFEHIGVFEEMTTRGTTEQKTTTVPSEIEPAGPARGTCPTPNDPSATNRRDVLFLLDSSRTVTEDKMMNALTLILNTVEKFKNIGPDGIQVSLVQFTSDLYLEFSLRKHNCKDWLKEDIADTEFMDGSSSMLGKALDSVSKYAFTKRRGDRPDAPNVLVVVTDGQSDDKIQLPVSVAETNNATVLVIATLEADPEYFVNLTGTKDNVFHLNTSHNQPLAEKLAQRISGLKSSTEEEIFTSHISPIETSSGAPSETDSKSNDIVQEPQNRPSKPSPSVEAGSHQVGLECSSSGFSITLNIPEWFEGVAVVKGYEDKAECRKDVHAASESENKRKEQFFIVGDDCGANKGSSEKNKTSSLVLELLHAPSLRTELDRAFLLQCFVAKETEVETNLDIVKSEITVAETVSLATVPPKCSYSIRKGSPNGEIVTKAVVGEPIYHRWDCDGGEKANDVYGIRIHDCFASDDVHQKYPIIDEHGCSADSGVVADPTYEDSNLSAYALSHAFGFQKTESLRFVCKLSLCTRDGDGCEGVTPPRCSPNATDLLISRRTLDISQLNDALTSALSTKIGVAPADPTLRDFVVTLADSRITWAAAALVLFVAIATVVMRHLSSFDDDSTTCSEPLSSTSSSGDSFSSGPSANPRLASFLRNFDRSQYV